jgi:signal transduction histidine kinase
MLSITVPYVGMRAHYASLVDGPPASSTFICSTPWTAGELPPSSPRIDARLRRAKAGAELHVEDYGPGISSVALPHLFSRYCQAEQAQGHTKPCLGLGPHIAKEIVEAHDGTFAVASQPGHGATFTILLPVATPASPAP